MNYYNLISMMPKAVAYDADAQAFITATGISGTNASAINTLVIDLKAANIWTKFHALYPIIGGTATSHKFNLKDPRDLDAAFRLAFVGGVTHSNNGILGNGTNSYANTFLSPSTTFPSGFSSMGIYNRVSSTNQGNYIGTTAASNTNVVRIFPNIGSTRHFNRGGATSSITNPTPNELGFNANSRISNVLFTSINNSGVFVSNVFNTTTAYSGLLIPLLATNNNGSYLQYSNAELSFAYISDALTSGELTTLKSINQTFQTTLGRQV